MNDKTALKKNRVTKALSTGAALTLARAAVSAGVSPASVARWRRTDAAFRSATDALLARKHAPDIAPEANAEWYARMGLPMPQDAQGQTLAASGDCDCSTPEEIESPYFEGHNSDCPADDGTFGPESESSQIAVSAGVSPETVA